MNIKPKAQIGEAVNIVNTGCIQTSYGFKTVHLMAGDKNNPKRYYVHDVKVEISLKTGEINYFYLIATSKEEGRFFYGGWVSDSYIELAKQEEVAV